MTDIKINFPAKHKDLKCRLGCNETENYEHMNECNKILNNKGKINMNNLWNVNLIQMKECNIMITRNIKIREQIEEEYNSKKRKDDKILLENESKKLNNIKK